MGLVKRYRVKEIKGLTDRFGWSNAGKKKRHAFFKGFKEPKGSGSIPHNGVFLRNQKSCCGKVVKKDGDQYDDAFFDEKNCKGCVRSLKTWYGRQWREAVESIRGEVEKEIEVAGR